jgi:hypothetical protein
MIYYISGVSKHSDLDIEKVKQEISKYEKTCIHELSIVEICTHFCNDLSTIKKMIYQVLELGCTIQPIDYSLLPINRQSSIITNSNGFRKMLDNEKLLDGYVNDSLQTRIFYESEVLNWMSIAITWTYIAIIHKDSGDDHEKIKYICENGQAMLASKAFSNLREILQKILYYFYENPKGFKLKDMIVEYFLDICELFVKSLFSNNASIENIEKRRLQKEELISSEFIKELDVFLKNIAKEINNYPFSNSAITNYYMILFKKFLVCKNKKIEKNDIIDTLLWSFYPQSLVLTADNDIVKSMHEIDSNYATQIKEIKERCKKC